MIVAIVGRCAVMMADHRGEGSVYVRGGSAGSSATAVRIKWGVCLVKR